MCTGGRLFPAVGQMLATASSQGHVEQNKKEMDGQRFERWTFRMQSEHSTN